MMTRYSYLVVADDLTGANDTGQQFAAGGLETVVVPARSSRRQGTDGHGDADVLVVDTESRTLDPGTAAASVRDAVGEASAERVYKKVDSTLRGNLAAEIDAALDASAAPIALVAPAFPTGGRVTVDGRHLVDETPVSEAPAVQERENPPQEADVTKLLSNADHPVVHVAAETVERGTEAVADRLEEITRRHPEGALVVCDATTQDHLSTLAVAGGRLAEEPLYVGSAGLAAAIGGFHRSAGAASAADATTARTAATGGSGRVLGVVGSTNRRTFDQLRQVPDGVLVKLDVERAIEDPTDAGEDLATRARDRLRADELAVVASATSPADVTAAVDAGAERGLDSADVRDRILTALTAAVDSLWADGDAPVDAVFASGGTVATSVFDVLAIDAIELDATPVEPGIPLGTATDRDGGEIAVVTKAGGFGTDETIVNCLATLGANVERA